MSATFAQLGNDLHAGRRSLPLVRRRKWWYIASLILLVVFGAIAFARGANLGIEFTGGSEFQISGVSNADQAPARDAVREIVPDNEPKITQVGSDTLRIQTTELSSDQTAEVASALASSYNVETSQISTSFIGPVWGSDITWKMVRAIAAFVLLVAVVMALYFRNLKFSLAAMGALLHDVLVTVIVYLAVGFEITPATVIGFLTILGYSLYDTIVVFDKVRENTDNLHQQHEHTYGELVELAANQTLIRSLNTSVVALLPVGSILAIGAFLLGAGTLKDIALALFIGIIAGTYSSVFLAPGFLVDLRRGEAAIREHTAKVQGTEVEKRSGRSRGHKAARTAPDDAADSDDLKEPAMATAGGSRAAGSSRARRSASASTQPSQTPTTRNQPRRTTRRERTGK